MIICLVESMKIAVLLSAILTAFISSPKAEDSINVIIEADFPRR